MRTRALLPLSIVLASSFAVAAQRGTLVWDVSVDRSRGSDIDAHVNPGNGKVTRGHH